MRAKENKQYFKIIQLFKIRINFFYFFEKNSLYFRTDANHV